jgi:hypothetical protein
MRNKFLIPKMAVIQEIGMRNKFLIDKVRDIIKVLFKQDSLSPFGSGPRSWLKTTYQYPRSL